MAAALALVLILAATVVLTSIAKRLDIPYPVAFVIGGIALAFVPDLPRPHLSPDFIFLLVLPPLLFSGGWSTDWYEFKRNTRPIFLLAFGLVIFTTVVVAAVTHAMIPGFTWPIAFVLGAIVSPPDAVAAEAVFERVPIARRILAILGGESLVNDATALVIYRFAVAAVVTGTFSLAQASAAFVAVSIGGILVGLGSAWVLQRLMRWLIALDLDDPTISNVVALLAPFAAYLPAEALHVSGVLAAVSAGIYSSRHAHEIFRSGGRLVAGGVWSVLTFLLNAFVFLMIGLQLPDIIHGLVRAPQRYLIDAAVVSVLVIVLRIVWCIPATYLPRLFSKKLAERDPSPKFGTVAIISWAGMRGIVSLAAALALPYRDATGQPLAARDEILFLTFCVIVATLVVQGVTLAPLARFFEVTDKGSTAHLEATVRIQALEAGIAQLHGLESTFGGPLEWEITGRLLAEYSRRIEYLKGHFDGDEHGDDGEIKEVSVDRRLERAALDAELQAIAEMRRGGGIPDEVYYAIQYDLDLAQARLT
ncbi:MAG: Na+/H+ antiporter [Vulcanimicrobiaceae bacterium]